MGTTVSDTSARRTQAFPAIAYAGCGYGWVMAFFTDTTLWRTLSAAADSAADTAYSIYFVLSCLFLFLASFLPLRFFGVGALVSSAGAVVSISAMALLPGEPALYLSAAGLGCSAGLTFALGFMYLIHRLHMPVKTVPIVLSLFSYYGISALALFIGKTFGHGAALFAALTLPVLAALAAWKAPPPLRVPAGGTGRPPLRLLAWEALLVVLIYTAYNIVSAHTVQTGSGFLAADAVLDWAARTAVVAFILLFGRSLNLVKLLYGSFVLIMMALVFRLMGPAARVPYGLLINLSFALTDLGIAVIVIDLSAAHRNSRWVFSAAMFVTVSSTLGGYAVGNALFSRLIENPVLFMGTVLILFCAALLFSPPLLRAFDRELSAVPVDGTDPQEAVVRNPSYARLNPERVLDMLDQRYDEDYRLSRRERDVALLLLDRYDYDAIAKRLGISVNTVKTHAKTIYQKYDIRGRKDLIELSLKPAACR